MNDGTKRKVDGKINRKLNKYYDLNSVIRMEAEFLMSADFIKMKADFNKLLINPSTSKESAKES